jgi:ribosome-binding protein aMBF1 (putative translation factor)
MRIIDKRNIDPMAKAKKNKLFDDYSKGARSRIVLATEIYKARTKKGISQQELAKQIKTTQKVISKIENAEVNLGIDLLIKITAYLGVKINIGNVRL